MHSGNSCGESTAWPSSARCRPIFSHWNLPLRLKRVTDTHTHTHSSTKWSCILGRSPFGGSTDAIQSRRLRCVDKLTQTYALSIRHKRLTSSAENNNDRDSARTLFLYFVSSSIHASIILVSGATERMCNRHHRDIHMLYERFCCFCVYIRRIRRLLLALFHHTFVHLMPACWGIQACARAV